MKRTFSFGSMLAGLAVVMLLLSACSVSFPVGPLSIDGQPVMATGDAPPLVGAPGAMIVNEPAYTALGTISSTEVNAAGGSADAFDYTGTAGIMNGSDTLQVFDINLTNADHTGSTNEVNVMDVAGITGDAHASEYVLDIGAGWDTDINFTTSGEFGVGGTNYMILKDLGAAGEATTTDVLELLGTTAVYTAGTNTDNVFTIDVAVGNASGGTNALRGVQIDDITGDAQVTETAINVGSGWDVGIASASPLDHNSTSDFADTLTLSKGSGSALYISAGGNVSVAGGDVSLANDVTGGDAGAKNQFIGLPRQTIVDFTTGTNPGSQTVSCIDTTPTGEWAEVDGGTNIVVTAATDHYRARTNSVKVAFSAGVENEGVDGTIAQVDLTDMESLAFWIYSDVAIASGDLDVTLDDTDGTDQAYSVGAVTAGVWTSVELDINACDANCDTTDGIHVLLTAQGAANADLDTASIYLDEMWFWDATDEEALGQAIVDWGVLYVFGNETAGGGIDVLVEGTDYFIHYESGSDFIVWITDQSTRDIVAVISF